MAQEPRPVNISLSYSISCRLYSQAANAFIVIARYTVTEIDTYPTVINAVTIVTTLSYGWTSDALQVRAPIVYFSLFVCFFAAMNLAIWDGVPFELKWASYYLTG